MSALWITPIAISVSIERWPLREPFRLTGHTYLFRDVLVVTLSSRGAVGKGEATGVRYRGEDAQTIAAQIENVRPIFEAGMCREALRELLPPGGARNALDCALWDLEAALLDRTVWDLAGISAPARKRSVITCGADSPDQMAAAARRCSFTSYLKLKLTGEAVDKDRVAAVKEARPDAWLSVDANQGFTAASLEKLMPVLLACGVELIEQPFPAGEDDILAHFESPILLAADESVQGLADLQKIVGKYGGFNIKLDKCGGLTEALMLVAQGHALGLRSWIGNTFGTSLGMAPAFVAGQACEFVELDGPLFLASDRSEAIIYADGLVDCFSMSWGRIAISIPKLDRVDW